VDYAERKKVYPQAVYKAIKSGKIIPDLIGLSRIRMIDLRIYGGYEFEVHNPDKTPLINWYKKRKISK
jgi:hypothetical protein